MRQSLEMFSCNPWVSTLKPGLQKGEHSSWPTLTVTPCHGHLPWEISGFWQMLIGPELITSHAWMEAAL